METPLRDTGDAEAALEAAALRAANVMRVKGVTRQIGKGDLLYSALASHVQCGAPPRAVCWCELREAELGHAAVDAH